MKKCDSFIYHFKIMTNHEKVNGIQLLNTNFQFDSKFQRDY